jgi:hypothetical protein
LKALKKQAFGRLKKSWDILTKMTKESNDPMIETLIDLKIFQTRRLKD